MSKNYIILFSCAWSFCLRKIQLLKAPTWQTLCFPKYKITSQLTCCVCLSAQKESCSDTLSFSCWDQQVCPQRALGPRMWWPTIDSVTSSTTHSLLACLACVTARFLVGGSARGARPVGLFHLLPISSWGTILSLQVAHP